MSFDFLCLDVQELILNYMSIIETLGIARTNKAFNKRAKELMAGMPEIIQQAFADMNQIK